MPAAAVASLTPATGGMSGNCSGASGEIVVVIGSSIPASCPTLCRHVWEIRVHKAARAYRNSELPALFAVKRPTSTTPRGAPARHARRCGRSFGF